jgi:hypothetical protein
MKCPRPRKQLLLKLGVFLLLGVVVNVAVAWECTTFLNPELSLLGEAVSEPEVKICCARWSPSGWEIEDVSRFGTAYRSFGRCVIEFVVVKGSEALLIFSVSAGWPAYSCGWGARARTAQVDWISCWEVKWWALPWGQVRLPLRPLWPGFAINTIFYAAVLWLLWFVPGKIRRFIRIRGHRCPTCGYQIAPGGGIGPVCSECGAALPAAWSTNES